MIQVLLLVGGFALGWVGFKYCFLPLYYGVPRAVSNIFRGVVRPGAITPFLFWALIGFLIQGAVALVLNAIGMYELVYGSGWYFAGGWLALLYGGAAALSRGGRAALDVAFWQAVLPYVRVKDSIPNVPKAVLDRLVHGADRVNEYFLDASRVYIHNADPAARLAALTAGKVADTLQRSSMVRTLRMIADGARNSDAQAAHKLDALADDVAEHDWSVRDIIRAKRELRDANAAYARALDAFDSNVFRREYPQVFSGH
ncbi:MAG: hypothetical protein Q7J25_12640 [Vicinamibacterales bacterium]|nr:hypothetical protein [Vicinamibacterales bacterium]